MAQKKTQRKAAKKAAPRKAAKKAAPRKAAKKAAPRKAAKTAAPGRPAAAARSKPARAGRGTPDPVAQIQRVIDVMVQAGAVEVELKDGDLKLRVRLKSDVPTSVVSYQGAAPGQVVATSAIPSHLGGAGDVAGAPSAPTPVDDPRRKVFTSPMVGTFYRSTAPDADPFAEVGDRVGPDSTLCILEAMKVMNEIKAEMSGEVVEVLAQNGEPVEFGQPLFVIKVD